MSKNARRRADAREASRNHGPVQPPNPGANRESRRRSLVPKPHDLWPMTDRRNRYARAAARAAKAAA